MMGRGVGPGSSNRRPVARRGRQTARRTGLTTPNGQAKQSRRLATTHAVFNLTELLEFILDYTVHDESAETRVNTLKSVRLVHKNWLTGLTNMMRKKKEPIFKLTLTKDNSLNGTPFVDAQGKLLDEFVAVMGQRIQGPFPTFKLKILKEFFRRENYDSLVTCLRQCGQGLVELEMIIPKYGGSLLGILPPVDLPSMHRLGACFTSQNVTRNMPGNELTFADSANIISLVQVLLNGTSSLKMFSVPSLNSTNTVFPAPSNFEFVTFPESITELVLKCKRTSENLEVLTRNKLPNLLTLKLLLHIVSYTEGLLSKIMHKFSEHLQSFTVLPILLNRPPRHVNFVRFPVMKKLRNLHSFCNGLELEEGHPPLSNCFPKLEVLTLSLQTPETLQKWTLNTTLNAVEALELGLIDESGMNYKNTLPITLESMQRVHLSFPNINKLTLNLSSGTQECGLKYLFMEMRQLNELQLIVSTIESFVSSDYWDSVFTGVPISVITVLRENDYWDNVELKLKNEAPSIRMLSALKYLYLRTVINAEDGEEVDLSPVISDLTFKFALMKMANLDKLVLSGRFKATNQMTAKWKNMGRCIEYCLF